ncbi:hypothetical protein [Paenibacillus cineris]|uniref:XRE family transcriptional regulator n=1 Tax=Paenibacillus cineris TaxID=237530 RepID=A0ABQ4LNK7_9BACL|nr:hypothetical protein [Paenibacillus cineris]GIO57955.1 hypothetical protein J21TS7_62730 [Paenibacillus cineris]
MLKASFETSVSKRIREKLLSKGIPFKVAAEKAGIPAKRFYRVMDGSSSLHADEVEKLCRVEELELNPTELLCP